MKNLILLSLFICFSPFNSSSQEDFWINFEIPDSVKFKGLVHLGGDTLLACSDNGAYITYDDCLHWLHSGLEGIELEDVFRSPSGDVFVSNHFNIWMSHDRGHTWADLDAGMMSGFPTRVFVDSNDVMYVTGNGNVLRSYDFFQTVDTVLHYVGGAPRVSRVAQNPLTKEFYVGYTDYMMMREGVWGSPNGDLGTWTVEKADPDFVYTIECSIDGKVYVGTMGHFTGFYSSLYVSDSNCSTWDRIYNEGASQIVISTNGDIYISGHINYGGIFYKQADDSIFIDITSNLTYGGASFLKMYKSHLYAVNEVGVSKSIEPIVSTSNIKKEDFNFEIYPNPIESGENLYIKLISGNRESYTIKIIDSFGRMIKNAKLLQRELLINTAGIPKGFYFVNIMGNDNIILKSIIIN